MEITHAGPEHPYDFGQMTPQQPELARSRHSDLDPTSAKARRGRSPRVRGFTGVVPAGNRPGHHPEREQDRPDLPRALDAPRVGRRFAFAFDPLLSLPSLAFGVTRATARVVVGNGHVDIGFGPWRLRTPLENVKDARVMGPLRWFRMLGPPRVSLTNRTVTFATDTRRGVRIRFHEPVPAALPNRRLRHPAAVVTVDHPDALVAVLSRPHLARRSA